MTSSWSPGATTRPAPGTPFAAAVLVPALLAAPPAALIAAAPSAVRVSAGGHAGMPAWALIAGLLVVPLLVATTAARAARHALAGSVSIAVTRLVFAAALALAIALPAQGVLGALLKAHTHHRPLAGATFAVLALAIGVFALVAGYRLAVLATSHRAATHGDQGTLRVAALVTCGLTLTLGTASALLLPAGAGQPAALRALLLDMALGVAVVGVGACIDSARSRFRGWPGALLGSVLLFGACALSRMHPELMIEVDAQAPLAAPWADCLRILGITR